MYRLRAYEVAAEGLAQQLVATIDSARRVRRDMEAGSSAIELVIATVRAGGPDERKRLHVQLRDFERALQVLRGESFRILVDTAPMTITDAARRVGVSAQMARRLYRVAEAEPLSVDEGGTADPSV